MSLQAWYPLNGHTNNYGIGDYPITATNMAYSKEAMSGGDMVWDANHNLFNKVKDLTICFWIYINEDTGKHTQNILIGDDDAGTTRQYSIFTFNTSNDLHVSTSGGGEWNNVFPSYKWTHCAIAFTETDGTIYINGAKNATFSHSTTHAYDQITHVCRTGPTRLIRDLRFYDEILSPKVIKEISKGLILHIPCKQPERIANLATKAIIAAGNAGNCYTTYDVDMPSVHCIAPASSNFAGILLPSSLFTVGSTYVLTYDFIDHTGTTTCVGGHSACFTTLEYYVDGIKSDKQYTDPQPIAKPYAGKRTHVYVYLKYNGTGNTDLNLYIQPGRGQAEARDFTVTNIRLSQTNGGDIPWAPPADMPSWDDIEYDCSGMGYNMIPYNNPPQYIEHSPGRYRCCYGFHGKNSLVGQNKDAIKPTNEISISAWYMTETLPTSEQDIICNFESGGAGLVARSSGVDFSIFTDKYYNAHTLIDVNTWYHLVGTYDGSNLKFYLNGELKQSIPVTGEIHHNANIVWVIGGNPSVHNTVDCFANCYLSDCRIYSTALSAADVKELYEQSASILNTGQVLTYSYQEEGVLS